MRRPGERLRRLALRICSRDTMTRLIDPVIADFQCEYADATRWLPNLALAMLTVVLVRLNPNST